ncbi:MAG: hypothetical protein CBB68_14090 [Rhodospirillaceae bacterium TMED8]|nr:hypothetical protein [Magnetovibrio sp.]OUT48092.1 MAG: hypothetical protein CBB68_14090 [Rhodospirillaceae bacterium TMED8]|tara:strand:+ start:93 stop:1148 length:1056 start_codon:yes stop_codon:yes gene_type:complete
MPAYKTTVRLEDFHPDTQAYFKGREVCVAGGSGFIGSHIVEQLLELDATPVIPTRNETPPFLSHLYDRIVIRHVDLTDRGSLCKAIKGSSVILNLAASVGGISYNSSHPATVFQANLRTFLNVVEAAQESYVERLLVTSSACIYPRYCTIPTPESEGFVDSPEATNSGYGWAKRMEEFLGQCCANEYGLEVAIARPYNAYGPRDNYNPRSSHVLPALILKAFENNDGTLSVWGDGRQSRSFLYVDDFARGLLEVTARYAVSEPINVGSDEEILIGEAARMIADEVGKRRGMTIKPVFNPVHLTGQPRRNCDTTKLKAAIGFKCNISFKAGLSNTIDWFEQNRELALTAHSQ